MMKNLKNCSKKFFTAQKKRLDALNATQKPLFITKYNVWKNQGKPSKNSKKILFFAVLVKSGNFWSFILIFQKLYLVLGAKVFALRLVHEDASFKLSKTVFGKILNFSS